MMVVMVNPAQQANVDSKGSAACRASLARLVLPVNRVRLAPKENVENVVCRENQVRSASAVSKACAVSQV
jgi:hypothetical protein